MGAVEDWRHPPHACPIPYALCLASYTPHPSPHTPHPTSCTLHPTPTLNPDCFVRERMYLTFLLVRMSMCVFVGVCARMSIICVFDVSVPLCTPQGHDVVCVDNLSRRNIDTEMGCDSLTPIQVWGLGFGV